MKFDMEDTTDDVIRKILEKIPGVDSNREYGVIIQSSGLMLKKDGRLSEYPHLASEKVYRRFGDNLVV
jgi:hypothetical protein